ncbi:hypothetical protein SKAU_G00188120 [Synaphobranchus kaupii]|uniref:Uncharacterized protein n=1 Tax=Synaphobranchus kaupii TaxID=118154 RepID=A0A9Q1IWZ3_SYNKA|nr:hypothetical protein SKAU_G00188120 [Synaphobranchus kaupii]
MLANALLLSQRAGAGGAQQVGGGHGVAGTMAEHRKRSVSGLGVSREPVDTSKRFARGEAGCTPHEETQLIKSRPCGGLTGLFVRHADQTFVYADRCLSTGCSRRNAIGGQMRQNRTGMCFAE